VNGKVKLEQAACGGSQWRMGPTFFKCFLFKHLGLLAYIQLQTLRSVHTRPA